VFEIKVVGNFARNNFWLETIFNIGLRDDGQNIHEKPFNYASSKKFAGGGGIFIVC